MKLKLKLKHIKLIFKTVNIRLIIGYKTNQPTMNFSLLDDNVSLTMNIFIIIANIINLFYNIPQMIKTYKTKSTRDFSAIFIVLRIIANVIWVVYSIEINSFLMLINNLVTVIASVFIGYYKTSEMYKDSKTIPITDIIHTEFQTSV